ncbi:MAG TPA: universal stress protein [Jatrophihabitans sp.]|jgi:nucleotide-binding universal stress UspA family protein|nr:universal stress protein [Jatrophihabitans sp.]
MAQHGAVVVGLGSVGHGVPELDWAAREARSRHRPLHIVRAYHLSQAALPWENITDRELIGDLRRLAEERVAAALSHVGAHWPDVRADASVVDGVAWDVLRDASRSAEVTVLGSRHLSAVGCAVLGSVSTVVAAGGFGPVVVVGAPPASSAELAQVVVGVDGSEQMDSVLAFAFDYASRRKLPLHAVYCWNPDLLATMRWRPVPPAPERANRWLAEAVAGWQEKYPDVVVRRGVIREHPVPGLVLASAGEDLLVVGSETRHARLGSLLGSVSQGVLHHATCPVAVVHPYAD